MDERPDNARLVVLAVLAFALFNYPLLSLFDREVIVLGVPLVWLYVFGVWGLLIVLVGVTTRQR
ncbi:MAG TPA: hypothetical protein VFZ64_14155 [Nocardioidaceae bacterium]